MMMVTSRGARFRGALLTFVLAAFVAGCAHAPTRPFHCDSPPPFHVTFQAAQNLNPDPAGNALPTGVRVLQLVSTSKLQTAQFSDLWQNAQKVLGPDLLRSDQVTVDPGATSGAWIKRDPRAQYVVAVGIFRQPEGNSWRATAVLPDVTPEQCGAQPTQVRTGPPGKGDVDLHFVLQDDEIEFSAPPKPAAQGDS